MNVRGHTGSLAVLDSYVLLVVKKEFVLLNFSRNTCLPLFLLLCCCNFSHCLFTVHAVRGNHFLSCYNPFLFGSLCAWYEKLPFSSHLLEANIENREWIWSLGFWEHLLMTTTLNAQGPSFQRVNSMRKMIPLFGVRRYCRYESRNFHFPWSNTWFFFFWLSGTLLCTTHYPQKSVKVH